MSDSWQAPRPTKRSRTRGDGEGEDRGDEMPEGAQQQRYEHQRPPPMHPYMPPPQIPPVPPYYGYPPGQPQPVGYPPPPPQYVYPHAQQFRYGVPPPEHFHQPLPQEQAYWEQHPHMRMPQYPSQPAVGGRGEYPPVAGAVSAASTAASSTTADSAAALGAGFPVSTAMGATAEGHITHIDVSTKRSKKNEQSRARAAKLRDRIEEIKLKPESERTEEELKIYKQYEDRRQKKNERSRERAIEKKSEVDRILQIPEEQRTEDDHEALEMALKAKMRKNEGDRLRRERIKRMGIKSGTPPRSRGRPKKQPGAAAAKSTAASTATEPISPLPPGLPHQEALLSSPSVFMSPGLMPSLGFPSPVSQRTTGTGASPPIDVTGEGGRSRATGQQMHLPMMPSESAMTSSWTQLHLPQRSSNVQQRRHPDGSMTISIFGADATHPSAAPAGGAPPLPPPDVPILYEGKSDDEEEEDEVHTEGV